LQSVQKQDAAMQRREVITLFGGAVVAATSSARAQQPAKSRRIGILETVSPALNIRNLDALRRGLRELGYIENQTYIQPTAMQDVSPHWRTNWCGLVST
jgi:hypothetical protein